MINNCKLNLHGFMDVLTQFIRPNDSFIKKLGFWKLYVSWSINISLNHILNLCVS